MTFLRFLPDRWQCWWRGPLPEPCPECLAFREACAEAVKVIDLYRARNQRLLVERDRAVRDLHDVLGLRQRNDVTSMLEENE